MQKFSYTARDERGKIIKGEMMAIDEVDLANRVANSGYFITGFIASKSGSQKIGIKSSRMNDREVLNFTIQLGTLIDAGLPLMSGLRDLATDSENDNIRRVIDDIRFRVESGSSLKDALSNHPGSFPKLYISIVGSGESTGKLSQALDDLSALLEWQMEIKSKIGEAATYPIILFIVMILVVILLLVKVVPMFQSMFEQLNVELPLPTQIVLGVSWFMKTFWWIILLVVGILVTAYKLYYRTVSGQYNLDSAKLKIPLIGDLLRKIALSRFTHTFSLSFKSGINLLTCLDIARETTANARLELAIKKARDSVNVGEKLATALEVSHEFPSMVVRMIAVGEQSGALTNILTKVSEFYDKDVASTIKKMFTAFEPIMIVIMGVVVGGIAMSVFLPLFTMIRTVGGD